MGEAKRRAKRIGSSGPVPGIVVLNINPGQVSARFTQSLMQTLFFDDRSGSRILKHGAVMNYITSPRIAAARNQAMRAFLADEGPGLDWAWAAWVDSDMVWSPEAIHQLVATAEAEDAGICGGLAFAGGYGAEIYPTLYVLADEDDAADTMKLERVRHYPMGSVLSIDATGAACMVIRRDVVEKVGQEWALTPDGYPNPHPWFAEQIHRGREFGEDLTLCVRARKLGFKVCVDTRVQFGHEKPYLLDERAYRAQLVSEGLGDLREAPESFDLAGPLDDVLRAAS